MYWSSGHDGDLKVLNLTLPMLEIRQMRQFVVVAEELNFRRAALRLNMSQPPLSVAMQNLEAKLGTMLLDRSRQRIALTAAGQVFYEDCQRTMLQVRMAMERARRAGLGLEGALRLSFVPSAALDVLPAILKHFQQACPTVHLQVTAETTARQLRHLSRGEVDLALVVGPVYEARELELIDLQAQRFVIAVPSGHRFAHRGSVRIKELATESFISFPASEGAGFVAALMGACENAGFHPNVVQEASQMQAILMLVAGGLGIALVPASLRLLKMNDVVFLEVADRRAPPSYRLQFAYAASSDNPAIQSFLAVAMQHATPLSERAKRIQPPN